VAGGLPDEHGTVVVAVTLVRMVQVVLDEEVDVVAVRDGLVAAALAVDVTVLVARAPVVRRALGGMLAVDGERVLVDVVLVRVMQVAVMEEVGVPFVHHRGVSAVGAVLVIVGAVNVMGRMRHTAMVARSRDNPSK
jgi:hypothetical protein